MFRFEGLSLDNFCQHSHIEVDFVPGTNGIIGPNGAGKSNLITGAFTCLTGRVLVGTIEENIKYNETKAKLRLVFQQDGVKGEISRSFAAGLDAESKTRNRLRSTAEFKFGDRAVVSGTLKVNDELSQLLRLKPSAINKHIFVSQAMLKQLLFQQPADRVRDFLELIPGVEQAEPLRDQLYLELARFPKLEVVASFEELKTRQQDVETRFKAAELKYMDNRAALATIDIMAATSTVCSYNTVLEAEDALPALVEAIDKEESELATLTVTVATKDKEMAGISAILGTDAPRVEQAKNELATLHSNSAIFVERQRAGVEIAKLLAEMRASVPPSDGGRPWTRIADVEKSRNTLIAAVQEHKACVDILNQGKNKCPTCGKIFDDSGHELKTRKALLLELEPQLLSVNAEIAEAFEARLRYERDDKAYQAWLDVTEARLASLDAALKNLPDVSMPDTQHISDLKTLVASAEIQASRLKTLETEASTLIRQIAVLDAKLEAHRTQRDTQIDIIRTKPATDALAAAEQIIKKHEGLKAVMQEAKGSVDALRIELETLSDYVKTQRHALERSHKVDNYRHLLESARDILHRDKLPSAVMSSYIRRLDALCNKFLEMFGNPFAVVMGSGMELKCLFPSGYVTEDMERLSGAQKSILSVAMRFAINELFAKDIGLLILDEPTEYMDDDNVAHMGELIERIHAVSQSSGVQTIVITHRRQLLPSFKHIIDLG